MAPLRATLAAVALVVAMPAHADQVERWRATIDEASAVFGIPAIWIERVMRTESAGLTVLDGRRITSCAGAIGLMQLMPATWADMRARLGLGPDPHDPHDNIFAGALYLRLMYDRFGYPGLFAAYNAGPQRYAASRAAGKPLPAETRAYLAAIGGVASARVTVADPPAKAIFFPLKFWSPISRQATAGGLFVVLGQPPSSD